MKRDPDDNSIELISKQGCGLFLVIISAPIVIGAIFLSNAEITYEATKYPNLPDTYCLAILVAIVVANIGFYLMNSDRKNKN